MAERSREVYCLAELYRVKGELLIQSVDVEHPGKMHTEKTSKQDELSPALVEAQSCFATSLAIPQQQHARSWEQRTKASIDHLQARFMTYRFATNTRK
jgi:hypothetical protein